MARHSSFTNMFRFVIALLTAVLVTVIGGLAVPAMAHDGSGSDSGSSTSGSDAGSNTGPGPNSGPGNADCHDNSGPGSTSAGSGSGSSGSNSGSNSGPGPNSGPGNADGDCAVDDGDDSGGDSSSDPGTRPSASNNSGSGSTVQAQPAAGAAQAGAEVPTAVNAGLTSVDREQSPPVLAVLAILLGFAMPVVTVVRRRVRV